MPIGHDGRTVYFSIDIEASGPTPGHFNMVSIGGVEVRWNGFEHEKGDSFYYEIKPDFPGFLPVAMRIHGLTKAHLEANGRGSKAVLELVTRFVHDHCARHERPLFVGFNAPFDWMHVAWYYQHHGLDNPFGYEALDIKAMLMGRHQLGWRRATKNEALQKYDHLEGLSVAEMHDALNDAEYQADILIALLDD